MTQQKYCFNYICFTVPKDGGEHAADHFEVLCGGGQIWWRSKPEIQKTNFLYAVAGGRAGDGEPFYVCKAKLDDFQTPGKLYKPTGCCYVSSYGKEHCMQDYFVMVTDFALDWKIEWKGFYCALLQNK